MNVAVFVPSPPALPPEGEGSVVSRLRDFRYNRFCAMEGLHNLLRGRIAALRGVGFGRFASHWLRRCEPTPKLRFRSLASLIVM